MSKILMIVKDSPYPIESGVHRRISSLSNYLSVNHSIDILMPKYTYRNSRYLTKEELNTLENEYNKVYFYNDKICFYQKVLKKIFKYSRYFTFNNIKNIFKDIEDNYDYIILSEIYFLPLLYNVNSKKIILDAMVPYYLQKKDLSDKSFFSKFFNYRMKVYEKKVINKVSYIMCISEDVLEYYSTFNTKLFLTKIPIDIKCKKENIRSYEFIFIGVNNNINLESLIFFKEKIEPRINFIYKVLITGSIANNEYVKNNFNDEKYILLPDLKRKEEYFLKSIFSISLIFKGYGLQTKVLEALTYGCINIISEKSNHAYKLTHLKNSIIYNSSVEQLVDDITNVFKNAKMKDDIRTNSYHYVKENFTELEVYKGLNKILL